MDTELGNAVERADFISWDTPENFFGRADGARLVAGKQFFLDRKLRHLQEAWTLGKLGRLIGADLVKLADVDPADGFMQYVRMTIPVEVTELLDEYRRRTDEFKPGESANLRVRHVSEAEIERAADKNVEWLEARIGAKVAKDERYPPNTVLVVYHNAGLWNFEPEQIPADLRKAAGISASGTVLVWLEHGHLHVVDTHVAALEAQQLARQLIPDCENLADSLIADRREEARREDANG